MVEDARRFVVEDERRLPVERRLLEEEEVLAPRSLAAGTGSPESAPEGGTQAAAQEAAMLGLEEDESAVASPRRSYAGRPGPDWGIQSPDPRPWSRRLHAPPLGLPL